MDAGNILRPLLLLTFFNPPRSEMGSLRDNVPQAGLRAAALTFLLYALSGMLRSCLSTFCMIMIVSISVQTSEIGWAI